MQVNLTICGKSVYTAAASKCHGLESQSYQVAKHTDYVRLDSNDYWVPRKAREGMRPIGHKRLSLRGQSAYHE